MKKLDELVLKAKNKLERKIQEVSETVEGETQVTGEGILTKKAGDGKIIVSAILIVIAVALCVTFRTELTEWLNELITRTTNGVQKFKPTTM